MAVLISVSVAAPDFIWPASAQQRGVPRELEACLNSGDAARGITSGIMECDQQELDRKDAALNAAYAELRKRLPPARFAKLRAAQRQWIVRRDKRCWAKDPDFDGGTLADLNAMVCLIGETEERTDWLRRYR